MRHTIVRTLFLTFRELVLILWNTYKITLIRNLVYKCLFNFIQLYSTLIAKSNCTLQLHLIQHHNCIYVATLHIVAKTRRRFPCRHCTLVVTTLSLSSLIGLAGLYIPKSWSRGLHPSLRRTQFWTQCLPKVWHWLMDCFWESEFWEFWSVSLWQGLGCSHDSDELLMRL